MIEKFAAWVWSLLDSGQVEGIDCPCLEVPDEVVSAILQDNEFEATISDTE